MASHWQAATLVASPSYPNSVAWSNENLVAVASGHIITILNPALLDGPRGTITLAPNKPFPIGVVRREDLFTPNLMPISLSRDARPCCRSLAWSQPGFAPNSGCLLAVCTTDGRVKLYRPSFCDFRSEWVEVIDISDLLYVYFENINFGEQSILSAPSNASPVSMTGSECADDLQFTVSDEVCRRKKRIISTRRAKEVECTDSPGKEAVDAVCGRTRVLAESTIKSKVIGTTKEVVLKPCSIYNQGSSSESLFVNYQYHPVSEEPPERKKNIALTLISPQQYASRSALLSCTIVAWSPVLQSSGTRLGFSRRCAILAVGGKSGNISFWKIYEPQYYTIEHGRVSVDPIVIGLLQAHNSWITAISWGNQVVNSLKLQLILVSGSSDGSVKIWLGDVEGLMQSVEAKSASFSLLQEVKTAISVPVSIVSLLAPSQFQDKVILAVGRGSGSIEAYKCDIFCKDLQSAGVVDAHDQVVTGLAWTFDGCCLYSCSQDNSVHCWVLHRDYLHKVSFPSNFPGLVNATSFSQVSDQCFGLASSPGNLMIAVVRSFDANLLDQMYQARTQKAVVEFFWTGGQPLEISSNLHTNSTIEPTSDLSERDFCCWGSNILWSLKNFEDSDKPLVLWEVLAALLAFNRDSPTFVENLLSRWISSWFPDSPPVDSLEKALFHFQSMLEKISSHKIHLLNIICRRLLLSDAETEKSSRQQYESIGVNNNKEKVILWNEVIVTNERELRQRLVALSFRAVLNNVACGPSGVAVNTSWLPVGVAQMDRWVVISNELVHNQLKVLRSKIRQLGSRIHPDCENIIEERCSFCSAPVQFESPEVAWCEGTSQDGSSKHKLIRCAVSMQLSSIISPMWFCICCQRWAANLAPRSFFAMPDSPVDVTYDDKPFWHDGQQPLCPFCGIMLQRSMPEFLLSINPV